jgi:nitrate reductase assembly molybdenum cofactor insertion protein NarJ
MLRLPLEVYMPLWFEILALLLLFGIMFYIAEIHAHLQDIRDAIHGLSEAIRERKSH